MIRKFLFRRVVLASTLALSLPLSTHAETLSCSDIFTLFENTQLNQSVFGGLNLDDRQVMLGLAQQNGYSLNQAPIQYQQDKEIVLAAVTQNGLAVQYAADWLKGNKEIAAAALRNNGLALRFVPAYIQQDKNLVLIAVQQNGCALKFVHPNLLIDKSVVMAAVKQNGAAIEYADQSQQKNPEIAVMALNNMPSNSISTGAAPAMNFNQDILSAVENALSAHLIVAQSNLFVEEATTKEERDDALSSLKLAETYRKFWNLKLAEAKIFLRKNPNLLNAALPESKQRYYAANQLLARAEKPKELRTMYVELIMADGNHEQPTLAAMDYAKDLWPQAYPEADVLRYIEQNKGRATK